MPELAVHVRHVSKTFRSGVEEVHALREVNLDSRYGEMLMIVGPSGCGKTTLLSVIAGTLKFDSGEIDVMGQEIGVMSDKELCLFRRKNIGFIFQQYHLIPTLTVAENVSIPLVLNNVDHHEAVERGHQILAEVGLEGRGGFLPRQLSGGQQQRVAIARALVHEPSLVICDEPTAALDAETGGKILELLKGVARGAKRTVLVVTHDNRIFSYADRIVKMDDGEVMGILTNNESMESTSL